MGGLFVLTETTISGNTAQEGGGLLVRFIVREKGAVVSNTVLARNTANQRPNCMGVVVPYGGNLVGVGKDCEFM